MSAPLHDTAKLRVGTVVQIALELADKQTGKPCWWKRFAVVTKVRGAFHFTALTLKLNPDFDKDIREISLSDDEDRERRQVVTILPEPWPQGVVAMHMKGLAMRWFIPEAED